MVLSIFIMFCLSSIDVDAITFYYPRSPFSRSLVIVRVVFESVISLTDLLIHIPFEAFVSVSGC